MDEEKVRKMMGIKDEDVDLYDIIDEVKNPLSSYTPYDDDDVYIGISWSEVKDDETGKQFKERTEAELEKLLGKKVKCETYEVAWSAY
jgi:L-fucose isomerase-like protein